LVCETRDPSWLSEVLAEEKIVATSAEVSRAPGNELFSAYLCLVDLLESRLRVDTERKITTCKSSTRAVVA
jgi:hypothetical protein